MVADALPDARELGDRATGEKVVDHRTSWVRRVAAGGATVFVKSYEYTSWKSRLGNLGRWTAPWRPSRAAREATALRWLDAHGLPTARPLLVAEWRRLGFVERATLVTEAFDGVAADRWLADADPAGRRAAAVAITAFVRRLHATGFRDRNLDLRNLLLRRDGGGAFAVAKIDSPRFVLTTPGARADALARDDRARLAPQLAAFGVALGGEESATGDGS